MTELMNQHVDIIIPNLNGKKFLDTCLDSIPSPFFTAGRVIVVDNGSTDGSVAYLQEHYPEVQVVAFAENQGFSPAVNAGIRAGRSPLVFLLNNDTELEKDCLQLLVQAAATSGEAFFAPKMLCYGDREVLDGAGDGYLRGGAGYRLGTLERDDGDYNTSRQVFGACAGAVLYRRAMLEEIGLFDEDFFAYLEDVDLNLRANRAGFSCRYVPEARVYHIGSATTGSKINATTVRLSTRNSIYVLAKHYSMGLLLRFFPAICLYQFFWFLFVIKKNQVPAYCRGLGQGVANLLLMRSKLSQVRSKDRVGPAQFADLLRSAEDEVVLSIMRRRRQLGKGNRLFALYRRILL